MTKVSSRFVALRRLVARRARLLAVAPALALIGLACCGSPAGGRIIFPSGVRAPSSGATILLVASAAREQTLADGSKRETGTFLGELYEPYQALRRAGHEVMVATIAGAAVAIDPESLKPKYWEFPEDLAAAQRFAGASALQAPLPLTHALAEAERFAGLVVPGGQGMMVDLLDQPELHQLLRRFAEDDRPIGLVCHAPALLTRLKDAERLQRRAVTSVSGLEELFIETFVMGERASVRGIGARLEQGGYSHHVGFPGSSFAVRDCNLVTSQNPFSTREFNRLYLQAVHDFRRGARCAG